MSGKKNKLGTILTHSGVKPADFHGAVNPPPHRVSTYLIKNYAEFEKVPNLPYYYGRVATPNSTAFASAMAELDGAAGSIITCSGLAAINIIYLTVTTPGDHVLVPDTVYGPQRWICDNILKRFKVTAEYYDPMIGGNIKKLFRKNTRMVFLESPGSLTYEVQDIDAIVGAARKARLITAMDNSWATPVFFRPLDHGIDMSIMSGTKYIAGHSDAMLGIVSATKEFYPRLKETLLHTGHCVGSEELYLGLRGLRTLEVRMKEHERRALELAKWLEARPEVKRVNHPALPKSAGHQNWKKYYSGSSGTFSIVLHETNKKKFGKMLDSLKVFKMGFSWGGYESLAFPEQPNPIRTAVKWEEKGLLLRLHVGFENLDDLKADIEQALKHLK